MDHQRLVLRGVQLRRCVSLPLHRRPPGGRSSYDICQFALSWLVRAGYAGSLDLSDFAVVMAGFYSADEAGSPWRVVLYIDARADSEQAVWLGNIFLGRAGGDTKRNFARAIGVVEASAASAHRARARAGALDDRSGRVRASGCCNAGPCLRTCGLWDTRS